MEKNILSIYGPVYKISKNFLEEVAKISSKEIKSKNKGIIDFSFVSKNEIKELNKKYRGKDQETDVLSFSFLDEDNFQNNKEGTIGQVVICYKVAKDQAKINKNSFEKETALLLIHGILHLFGYDHKDYNQKEQMIGKEKIILSKLGFS